MVQSAVLDHISLLVSDIDASTRFYVEVFGFEVVREYGEPIRGRWVGLAGRDILHLNQDDFGATHVEKDTHFAIRVDDFDGFVSHLNAIGVAYQDWPGETGKISHHTVGFRQLYMQDPDGYWLEVNDRTAAYSNRE